MKYSAKCHCGEITVEMEHDPDAVYVSLFYMPSKSGTSISAAWPEHEINITGNLKSYKIVGGSGMDMYYYYCHLVVVLYIINLTFLKEWLMYLQDY